MFHFLSFFFGLVYFFMVVYDMICLDDIRMYVFMSYEFNEAALEDRVFLRW